MEQLIDNLSTVAEFSIGLAGFAGIVAALTQGASEVVRFRFQNLLLTSFVPGFFALLVIGSSSLGIPDRYAVLGGSVGLSAYILAYAGFAIHRSRTLPFGDQGLSRLILRFFQTTSMTVLALQLCGLVFFSERIHGFFYYGLVILLFQGAVSFATLALSVLGARRQES